MDIAERNVSNLFLNSENVCKVIVDLCECACMQVRAEE